MAAGSPRRPPPAPCAARSAIVARAPAQVVLSQASRARAVALPLQATPHSRDLRPDRRAQNVANQAKDLGRATATQGAMALPIARLAYLAHRAMAANRAPLVDRPPRADAAGWRAATAHRACWDGWDGWNDRQAAWNPSALSLSCLRSARWLRLVRRDLSGATRWSSDIGIECTASGRWRLLVRDCGTSGVCLPKGNESAAFTLEPC